MKTKLKFTLSRIRLNNGGYDRSGRYWGVGAPLYDYQAEYETNEIQHRYPCRYRFDDTVSVQSFCQECGEIPRRKWESIDGQLRAGGRNDAKAQIRAKYPLCEVSFYR